MPKTSSTWTPPMGVDTWEALCDRWAASMGPFDGIAVYERPQVLRPGIGVLLLRRDRPTAFIKSHTDHLSTDLAWRVLQAMTAQALGGWHVPEPLDQGKECDWAWLASAPLEPRPHRPARKAPIAEITARIRERLDGVLDRTGTPDHWEPMHGDLTPWNLRRTTPRSLWLFDWEDAAYGPPGADDLFYAATTAMLPGSHGTSVHAGEEAVEFWVTRARRRAEVGIDAAYNRALAARLAAMPRV